MAAGIVEFLPSGASGTPTVRVSTAPRGLATAILLWVTLLSVAVEAAIAIAAALVSGAYLHRHGDCIDNVLPRHPHSCYFTFAVVGLTLPLCAGVAVVELLPTRLVSPGVRNLAPLALLTVGTILWAVHAATIVDASDVSPAAARWHGTAEGLAWANCALFLAGAVLKLLGPAMDAPIDALSVRLGRLCPDGCLPACDACFFLDARTAKVPREVLRHGRVAARFLAWDAGAVAVQPMAVLPPMARGGD